MSSARQRSSSEKRSRQLPLQARDHFGEVGELSTMSSLGDAPGSFFSDTSSGNSQLGLYLPPTTTCSPPRSVPAPPATTSTLAALHEAAMENACSLPATQRAQFEEMVQRRIEPYERVIAALEEKQKLYDDQELRVKRLAKALEEQEQKTHEFYTKLYETSQRCSQEVEAERELAHKAVVSRSGLEREVAELQQEVDLRKTHEESLQKRIALMENELSVVHQKCVLIDSIEEHSQSMQREVQAHKEMRAIMEEKLQAQGREAARLQEELHGVHTDHRKEFERVNGLLLEERRIVEKFRSMHAGLEDAARDKEVEYRLRQEKHEELTRQVSSLESEVMSTRALLEQERAHRKEAERRFEDQELKSLHAVFDEHRQSIRELREENRKLKQLAQEEQGRADSLDGQIENLHAEVARERLQSSELRQRLELQTTVREENEALRTQHEELRAQVNSMQQETRRMTEHYEREFGDQARAEELLSQERGERQQEIGHLQAELSRAKQHVHELMHELQMQQEQMSQSFIAMRETADRSEDYQRHLQHTQEELRGYQGETYRASQRTAELQQLLEDRNNEIKLLMYRVQELSSKYTPVRGDNTDSVLAKWVNGYRPAVPFFRLAQGSYLFGRRQVSCKIANDKPVFRVKSGNFISFEKFLELYASEELEGLLNYEIDERTGEPKFAEAQRVRQLMEVSGAFERLRSEQRGPREDSLRSSRKSLPPCCAPSEDSLRSSRKSLPPC
mmetsp:Transcript_42449/g.79713  ORF Transcript_42449/g.79713 Transcript_42449/m.79713 type:complete len:735 (-) Transcript_42449:39-2243(-)